MDSLRRSGTKASVVVASCVKIASELLVCSPREDALLVKKSKDSSVLHVDQFENILVVRERNELSHDSFLLLLQLSLHPSLLLSITCISLHLLCVTTLSTVPPAAALQPPVAIPQPAPVPIIYLNMYQPQVLPLASRYSNTGPPSTTLPYRPMDAL